MAEVKWIKLMTDMFDNSKIRYIRTLPEGNNIVLIWVMLLAKAGKCNSNGFIFLTESIPYTPDMLAAEFNFEINTVNLALITLSKLNMIQMKEEKIEISGWEEYQNVESLEKIRIQTKKRVQKHRENQKKLESNVTCNVTVTESNATEEEEEEERRKKNKNKKEDTTTITSSSRENGGSDDLEILSIASKRNLILSPIQQEQILEDVKIFSLEEVSKALEIADDNGKRTYSYVRGILQKRRADSSGNGGHSKKYNIEIPTECHLTDKEREAAKDLI